jgi:hypothetical protein
VSRDRGQNEPMEQYSAVGMRPTVVISTKIIFYL